MILFEVFSKLIPIRKNLPPNLNKCFIEPPCSFWFLVVCVQSLLSRFGFKYLCVCCGIHTTAPREPRGLITCALQKRLIIDIIQEESSRHSILLKCAWEKLSFRPIPFFFCTFVCSEIPVFRTYWLPLIKTNLYDTMHT